MFKVKDTVKVQNVSECLSLGYFLSVSDHVCTVSPEPLNYFFFTRLDMVVYYHEVRQCVLQKNWFTIFNVKVTVRAYITKL